VAHSLLAPIVARGERSAAVLIPFLIATRSQVKREGASWRLVPGCEQLEAGRQAVATTDDERDDLAEALSRLEAVCR
jgi:hypothetical protein